MTVVRCIIFLLCTTTVFTGWSQESEKPTDALKGKAKRQQKAAERAAKYDNYTVLGISFCQSVIQDTKMSPLVYSGPGIGIRHQTLQFGEKSWLSSRFEAAYAIPGRNGADASYTNINLKYQLMYARKTNWWKEHLYFGGAVDVLDQIKSYDKLGNSSFNNDLVIGLHPVVMLRKKQQILKRSTIIFGRMGFNLVSYVNRIPTYQVGFRESNGKVLPIGQFNRFRWECGLHMPRKWSLENRIGFEYSWDFYAMNEFDKLFKLRAAQHLLTINYFIKTR